MNYQTFIPQAEHVYRFTKEKQITEKITAMAAVEVFNLKGYKIGGYAFSRSPRNAFDTRVTDMVKELIREYELRKIWSK